MSKPRPRKSPAEVSAARKAAAAQRKTFAGGRPRSRKARCDCGAMTASRAKARYHHCIAK